MVTGSGFLRAPPFPASPFACPVPVSLRSCNRSVQLRNVCDAPGIFIPAYAGRSLTVQSIIHYFAAEKPYGLFGRSPEQSSSVHRVFSPVHRIRPGTRPGGFSVTAAARPSHGAGLEATHGKGYKKPN